MKTALILTAVLFLTFGAVVFAQNGISSEQQARLDEIETYIEAQRQSADKRYAQNASLIDYRLAILEAGDNYKSVQGDFEDWAEYVDEILLLSGVDLRQDKEYARILRDLQRKRQYTMWRFVKMPRLLAIAENRLAVERVRLEQQLTEELGQLEKQKNYTSEVYLAELENNLIEQVMHPAQPAPQGVVTGIVYSDKPAAIIGSDIVHLGDTVGKITVTKITPDSVEFERGKKQWTQAVGEQANSAW